MSDPNGTSVRRAVSRVDVRVVTGLALVGATIVTATVLFDAYPPGEHHHPANVVHPGKVGPSAAVFRADFPGEDLPDTLGHDGQQFYAIARQPLHPVRVAPDLDRPRYRLQRIAFPLLVSLLHPGGGGGGLVAATVVVGAIALAAGAFATGILSLQLGGPKWMALLFCLMPGAFAALRISTADTLALGAAIGAIALSLAGRHRWAVASAALAVLAKESLWLVLAGHALWRRDRAGAALAGIPALLGGAWWVFLRVLVVDNSEGVTEFVLPFTGLAHSMMERWMNGEHLVAAMSLALAFECGVLALLRVGLDHPLGWPILLQLILLPFLSTSVLGPTFNATRMTMPLIVMAFVAMVADERKRLRADATAPSAGTGSA